MDNCHPTAPLQAGHWSPCAGRACGFHTACLDGNRRGKAALFRPSNCTMRRLRVSTLRGRRIMLVGDSLVQYQFDALLAWLRRAGINMRCRPVPDQVLFNASQQEDETVASLGTAGLRASQYAAIRELMSVSKYESAAMDCFGAGKTVLMSRRLNLLPLPDTSLERHLDALFRPLGGSASGAVVMLNVHCIRKLPTRHPSFLTTVDARVQFLTRSEPPIRIESCSLAGGPALWPSVTSQGLCERFPRCRTSRCAGSPRRARWR